MLRLRTLLVPNFYLDDRITGANLGRALEFLSREYVQQGAALFGRETAESLNDFRRACGGAIDRASDREVYQIILFAVQRRKNYTHIVQGLYAARFRWGMVSDSMDSARFPFCQFMAGKYFRVKEAALAISTLLNLSLAEQGSILNGAAEKAANPKTIDSIERHMERPHIIPGYLHFENLGVPPFHRECTCLVEGVDKEEVE